jgi:polysaccharide pyruvyl transferase WcaK-like protein
VNNCIQAGSAAELQRMLDSYRESDLVVSSRLHGCIIALALGKKVLAISGDRKVESFMARAGLGQWVVDAQNVQAIPGYLKRIEQQGSAQEFIDTSRQENMLLGRQVEHLLGGGAQPAPRQAVKP